MAVFTSSRLLVEEPSSREQGSDEEKGTEKNGRQAKQSSALDDLPPLETEDERILRELAQLWDAREAYCDADGKKALESENQMTVPTMSERFMGMKAAVVTNNSAVRSFGEKLGFIAVDFNEHMIPELPMNVAASKLLKLLGFEDGRTMETSQFDLVFVQIGSYQKPNGQKDDMAADDAEYMNGLVGKILQTAQSGSEVRSRLHLSLVMSYGDVSEDDTNLSLLFTHGEKKSDLSVLSPRQSYTMKTGKLRTNIRQHCPMLVAQWQEAVTRRDTVEMLSFDDLRKRCGNLVIPADRFLYEIAFKLWKAPKYGA
ncbi:hypothetical protein Nepgr_000947 [Nepenthes gracilis]|uniref:Uncharacterized protein n=1 Tax=Nepenthes gracilis TaxID=150966 RepID=A0AAD3P664_NEPGR|nr:hypothetical protein Nepgr_000947 [Nepenthes gracilis]